jgi:hypothetical protein
MALMDNMQDRFKTSTNAVALLGVRVATGLLIGLTLALIGQEIVKYGWLSFVLVILVTAGLMTKISKNWTWLHLLIFNLICVLIALILRMYILIAPNA